MANAALTVGMLTHEDFDGVFMSIQSIVAFHQSALPDIHFVVVDNSPDSPRGMQTAAYCAKIPRCHYTALRGTTGTALRNVVFEVAPTDYVLCMDSHCFIMPNALERLIRFYTKNPNFHDLIHGPLLDESLAVVATSMDPYFRGQNLGTWNVDNDLVPETAEPKEIVAHGMGLFACSRVGWPRFAPGMRMFGGEEVTIHEKFRLIGRKSWCFPFLRWIHRFQRPDGAPYPNSVAAKAVNICLALHDARLPIEPALQYYSTRTDPKYIDHIREIVPLITPTTPLPPEGYVPLLGKTLQALD
jgi:hypothetical protein